MSEYPEINLYIDGEWLGAQGRECEPVVDPATTRIIGQVPHADTADLDRALESAQSAFPA